ncbi:MAG: ABC transporter permease [Chloroflexi bacterium]|nr:ABC transporter permease [Chloroflexota bacterium]
MAQSAQILPHATATVGELLTRKPASLYRDAMIRLVRNRASVAGLVIVAFFSLVALLANVIAPKNALESFPNNSERYPSWVVDANPAKTGRPEFPLGTDSIGRDVLSRVIFGARTSMVVGFIPMILIVTIGTIIGLISGFFGGAVDNFLMRLTDVVYAFPDLLFFIIVMTALRDSWIGGLFNGLFLLFGALAVVNWVGVARLVRGQVLSLKEKEFVEAARAIGASNIQIIFKHLLPNTLSPVIVSAAFLVPQAIVTEATLGFIGVGIRPATDPAAIFPTSWGNTLLEGRLLMLSQPSMLILSSICIAAVLLSFTFIGDGLRDALDPRQKNQS